MLTQHLDRHYREASFIALDSQPELRTIENNRADDIAVDFEF